MNEQKHTPILRVGLRGAVGHAPPNTFYPIFRGDGDTRGNLFALFKDDVEASNFVMEQDYDEILRQRDALLEECKKMADSMERVFGEGDFLVSDHVQELRQAVDNCEKGGK